MDDNRDYLSTFNELMIAVIILTVAYKLPLWLPPAW